MQLHHLPVGAATMTTKYDHAMVEVNCFFPLKFITKVNVAVLKYTEKHTKMFDFRCKSQFE